MHSTYVRSLGEADSQGQKVEWWWPGAGGRGEGELMLLSLEDDEDVLGRVVVTVAPQCECT